MSPIEFNKLNKVFRDIEKAANDVGVSFDSLKKEGAELSRRGFNADEIRKSLTKSLVVATDRRRRTYIPESNARLAKLDDLSRRIYAATGVEGTERVTSRSIVDLSNQSKMSMNARAEIQRMDSIRYRLGRPFRGLTSRIPRRISLPPAQLSEAAQARAGYASLGAIIGGGYISSKATGRGGRATGSAITGAGIGAQFGLMTGNPLIAVVGAAAGAFISVKGAVESFEEELRDTNIKEAVESFFSGDAERRGRAGDRISGLISGRAATVATTQQTSDSFLRQVPGLVGILARYSPTFSQSGRLGLFGGDAQKAGAFGRASLIDRISTSLIFKERDRNEARTRIIEQQQQKELDAERTRLKPVFEQLQKDVAAAITGEITRSGAAGAGRARDRGFEIIEENKQIFALFSDAIQDISQISDPNQLARLNTAARERVTSLARAAALESDRNNVIRDTQFSLNSFKDAISRTTAGLEAAGQSLQQSKAEIDAISQRSTGQLVARTLPNLFSNPEAFSSTQLRNQVFSTRQILGGASGRNLQTFGNVAVAGNELRAQISGIFQKVKLDRQGFGANIGQTLATEISKSGALKNVPEFIRQSIYDDIEQNVSEQTFDDLLQEPQNAIKKLSPIFEQASTVVENFVARLNEGNAELFNAINQRVQIERKVVQSRLDIQGVRAQSADFRRSITGRGLSRQEGLDRLIERLTILTGTGVDPQQAGQNIQRLRARQAFLTGELDRPRDSRRGRLTDQQLIQELSKNSLELQNNIQALQELSQSTDLLKTTQDRLTDLERARAGSQSFLEEVAGASPAEIREINRQVADASTLLEGGMVPFSRIGPAIDRARQLLDVLKEDDWRDLGITRQQAEENVNFAARRGAFPKLNLNERFAQILIENARAPAQNEDFQQLFKDQEKITQLRIEAMTELSKIDQRAAASLNNAVLQLRQNFVQELNNAFGGQNAQTLASSFTGLSTSLEGPAAETFVNATNTFSTSLDNFTKRFGDNPPTIQVGGQVDFNMPIEALRQFSIGRDEFNNFAEGIQTQLDTLINGREPAPR